MKKLQPTSQFKRDYKRYRNNPKKIEALKKVLIMLQNEVKLPANYLMHSLQGQYRGCFECHIGPDYLLVWFDMNSDIIQLVRLGSHAELFG